MDSLFLEEYVNIDIFQKSDVFEAVNRVAGKPADRFRDYHINSAALAHPDHLVELIAVLDAGARYAFVRENSEQLPFRFSVDFLSVISRLNLVAVDLFLLLCGYPAIRRHTFLSVFVLDFFSYIRFRRYVSDNFFSLRHMRAPFSIFDR